MLSYLITFNLTYTPVALKGSPPFLLGKKYCTPQLHISNGFKHQFNLKKKKKKIIPVGFQGQHTINNICQN